MQSPQMPRDFVRSLVRRLLVRHRAIACEDIELGATETPVRCQIDGAVPSGEQVLVGTSTGLLRVNRHGTFRILYGDLYGITKYSGRWYVLRRIYQPSQPCPVSSQLLSMLIGPAGAAHDIRVEIPELDADIHQVDFIGRQLFITDTKNNCILKYAQAAGGGLRHAGNFFPHGGREQPSTP